MRDREYLVALLHRMIVALGIAGTLVGVIGEGTDWQAPVGVILLSVLVLLVGLDLFYHIRLGIPWWKVRRGIAILIQKLRDMDEDFSKPYVVIGFGRAGSVVGATLAANLGRIPFIALDIQHKNVDNRDEERKVIVNGPIELKPEELHGKQILLVSAYLHSGKTYRALLKHLKSLGIKNSEESETSEKSQTSQKTKLCHATLFVHPDQLKKSSTVDFVHAFEEDLDLERWKITPWHIKPAYRFR